MSDAATGAPALAWDERSGGVDWHVELDRAVLLPGRLVDGRLVLTANDDVEARGLVVSLTATEHWRHRVTRHGPNNTTTTEVVTSRVEAYRQPVRVREAVRLARGERLETAFQLPVPPMGPATLDAEDAGLAWVVEARLDIDNAFDSATERPIVVAQPTALLRAGSVRVAEFALYEGADVAADGIIGSIHLEPMPLVCGEAFEGRVTLELGGGSIKVQAVRAELRVEVEATVGQGERQTIIAWAGALAPEGSYQGFELPFSGSLDPRPLPTVELPHGRAFATFHVVLARAWAIDTHLARDVSLATTREL
jgi:hypothetical protein